MNNSILNYNEIINSKILKPNFHLNFGKRRINTAIKNGLTYKYLTQVVDSVYTGGIFKRIFVSSEKSGIPYISAQYMMNSNPRIQSKLISKKYTPRQGDMILKNKQILVSCAGTIGNIRLVNSDLEGVIGSQDIIRVIPKDNNYGFVYAYLASKTCYEYLQSLIYGSVVPRIDPISLGKIIVPNIEDSKQLEIHNLIVESSILRVEANKILNDVTTKLYAQTKLKKLDNQDYNYFGPRSHRKATCFSKNIKGINTTTFNAFNYSIRVEHMKNNISSNNLTCRLEETLNEKKLFSTGSFPRKEISSDNAIMLINQTDIFDTIINGKKISRKKVNTDNLAKYGEVLIAGVGTLGETESFCRVIFVNEEIEGQLISGEFIRMNTNSDIPSGYLFAWLNSDYGFRLIRSTHSGTKLCRPIPRLLLNIPVPILDKNIMLEIHNMVTKAHTLRYQANQKELQAIQLVENEIEQWQH